jgi:DNA-binding Lrp family transcriptional regulator
MQAFILLSCSVGAEHEVLDILKKTEGITNAMITYGDYDIVAKAETKSGKEMDVLISTKIRQLQKVRSTVTLHVTD